VPTQQEMVKRQKVLAEFGELALASNDLDEVLTEACRLIGGALGTDLAKVLELQDDGRTLFMRAGIGWPEGMVGEVRLQMSERSLESYSINKGEPVITEDIEREDRFTFPDFMKEAGVVGLVNVPIFLPGREPYGLLQVDSREPWKPSAETTEFLRAYAMILGPVLDRLHKARDLRVALERNQTLFRELQHRIKNNIGAINSLVRMRERRAKSEEIRAELQIVGERIEALRLVHEQVYADQSDDRLSLRSYVTKLLGGLLDLHREKPVRLEIDIEEVELQSDRAVPLGLILNEFTTNSLKYAFHDREDGRLIVSARCKDDCITIRICDDGPGLPALRQPTGRRSGTGMWLIESLSRQLGAEPHWSSDKGASLMLEFQRRE